MKAVILAAGEGTRLRPLTLTRSKHMIPLAGKPVIEYLLSAIREAGITEVLMVVRHYKELIQNYFGDGKRIGLKIDYLPQEELLGTANAIGLAEEYIGDEDFFALYGDLLIDSSVLKSVNTRYEETQLTTLSVVPVSDPQKYGLIILENGLVKEIIEKPTLESIRGNLVNAGVYIFKREVFDEIRKTSKSKRMEYEITDTIQLLLKKNVQIASNIVSPEVWMDVGYPWDLLEANERVLKHMKQSIMGEVEDDVHVKGTLVLEEEARIHSGAYIEGPVYVGKGSDIGPNCYIRPSTSIGRGVHIGNACEVKNSLILDETHMGHLSYVGDSIVGENCNLGAGTITANLRFDKKTIKVRVKEEVVDSGRRKLGVIMGDNVQTGIGVSIMPGIKLGLNAWIGPNVTVYEDVPSEKFVRQKQDLEHINM